VVTFFQVLPSKYSFQIVTLPAHLILLELFKIVEGKSEAKICWKEPGVNVRIILKWGLCVIG
jgi:hypothetical protein